MKGGQEQGQQEQQEQQRGMVLCNCVCAWQPVRVVHGDGHIRRLTPPVTVAELLKWHPHHFVCEPTSTGPMYHSGMLPVDMELEEGRIYLLLPLPRLLPHLASNFPNPPSCPCFSHHRDNNNNNNHLQYSSSSDGAQKDIEQQLQGKADMEQVHEYATVDNVQAGGQFLVVAKSMRKLRHRVGKSKLVRSLLQRMLWLFRFHHRRADNQSDDQDAASSNAKAGHYSCSRNRWTPGLECISEVDLLTGLLNRDSGLSAHW